MVLQYLDDAAAAQAELGEAAVGRVPGMQPFDTDEASFIGSGESSFDRDRRVGICRAWVPPVHAFPSRLNCGELSDNASHSH